MINFIFWNINHRSVEDLIYTLISNENTDVIVLAECKDLTLNNFLFLCKKNKIDFTAIIFNENIKIRVLIRKSSLIVHQVVNEGRRIVAIKIFKQKLKFLLIALHFQSKFNWSNDSQNSHSAYLKEFIDISENKAQFFEDNTIVCGDFNMNPFDQGMIQNYGLHSVMEKSIFEQHKAKRKIDGKDYKLFYNPMWAFLGDCGKGSVSGTFYYHVNQPSNYYWNLFDQVLLRPSLMDNFDFNYLDIVTQIGTTNLVENIVQNNKIYPDHLPLRFKLLI